MNVQVQVLQNLHLPEAQVEVFDFDGFRFFGLHQDYPFTAPAAMPRTNKRPDTK